MDAPRLKPNFQDRQDHVGGRFLAGAVTDLSAQKLGQHWALSPDAVLASHFAVNHSNGVMEHKPLPP